MVVSWTDTAAPTVDSRAVGVVTVGLANTVQVKATVRWMPVMESVATRLTDRAPAVVAAPEMTPAGDTVMPAGSVPPPVQANEPEPPETLRVTVLATPSVLLWAPGLVAENGG